MHIVQEVKWYFTTNTASKKRSASLPLSNLVAFPPAECQLYWLFVLVFTITIFLRLSTMINDLTWTSYYGRYGFSSIIPSFASL